jgi:hypothetical protein
LSNDCKDRIQNADSYQTFRDVWLEVKNEIEYMLFQEEIIYIRYLCGIDYSYSMEEVRMQGMEEPPVYALRDECDKMTVILILDIASRGVRIMEQKRLRSSAAISGNM